MSHTPRSTHGTHPGSRSGSARRGRDHWSRRASGCAAWVFINGTLAINIGGVHPAQSQSISLDLSAAQLGIQKGKTYGPSIFQAERHTTESSFRVDTTIGFTNCNPIIR